MRTKEMWTEKMWIKKSMWTIRIQVANVLFRLALRLWDIDERGLIEGLYWQYELGDDSTGEWTIIIEK